MAELITNRPIEEEMKQAYVDYAMSVIVGRALPDIRDGLKPVHRRILFAMHEMGNTHDKPTKKSARIVGEVLGKFHPHGDISVYDALVRMVQDFSLRYPLVGGQGNWGSVDGDNAAAMRYTEARLSKIAEEMLSEIEKNTVNFVNNFDATLKEPLVLPSKIPNLLINGSSGIAVGMATNMPPYNIKEICDAMIYLVKNENADEISIMQFIKGPDFPTGGIILGKEGLIDVFKSGKGMIKIQSKIQKQNEKIIITEIPYQVNKSTLISEIADMVRDKRLVGIKDIRDESDKNGLRIIVDISKNTDINFVERQLLSKTKLMINYHIANVALKNGKPGIFSIKEICNSFIEHRLNIVVRRSQFDLDKAKNSAHILEGIIIILKDINKAIEAIKKSKTVDDARKALIELFELSDIQAKAVLDLKLQRLASLEQEKIRNEHKELIKKIADLTELLSSEEKRKQVVIFELDEIKEKYDNGRKTQIISEEHEEVSEEELLKDEKFVVVLSKSDYIKRVNLSEYREQKRGGKGVITATSVEGDFIKDIFSSNTKDYLLVFTNLGNVHWIKTYELPLNKRTAKGTPIVNLLSFKKGETISSILPVWSFEKDKYLTFVTKNGQIKKTELTEYSNPRKGGIIAINIHDDDQLVKVNIAKDDQYIMIGTKKGKAVRFLSEKINSTGRNSAGVRGVTLEQGDCVIGLIVTKKEETEKTQILTITEKGYGKRTIVSDYRETNRGGKGVININITEKNGDVVAIESVEGTEKLMVATKNGISISTSVEQIALIGRNTQGVRIIKVEDNDSVSAASIVKEQ